MVHSLQGVARPSPADYITVSCGPRNNDGDYLVRSFLYNAMYSPHLSPPPLPFSSLPSPPPPLHFTSLHSLHFTRLTRLNHLPLTYHSRYVTVCLSFRIAWRCPRRTPDTVRSQFPVSFTCVATTNLTMCKLPTLLLRPPPLPPLPPHHHPPPLPRC